jgi:hypothetical protein
LKAKIQTRSDKKISVRIQGVPIAVDFELDEPSERPLTPLALGNFLALVAFPFAMKKGLDLALDFPVDKTLARNLHELSIVWSQYRPLLFNTPIKIESEVIDTDSNFLQERTGNLIAFSGGIDSTYAFAVNQFGDTAHPYEIEHAIMIDGFGYDLTKKQMFDKQKVRNADYLGQFGIKLSTVRTNWSKVLHWYQLFHTVGIAAVMNLYSQTYRGGIIGLDFTYGEEFPLGPWGNTSLIDRLLCSKDFSIHPMGANKSRTEKLIFLAQNNSVSHLAVCNFMGKLGRNCSHCEKCVRTMLGFISQNREVPKEIFSREVTVEGITGIDVKKATQYIFFKSLMENWTNPDTTFLVHIEDKVKGYEFQNGLISKSI